jgi:hypothetical protein
LDAGRWPVVTLPALAAFPKSFSQQRLQTPPAGVCSPAAAENPFFFKGSYLCVFGDLLLFISIKTSFIGRRYKAKQRFLEKSVQNVLTNRTKEVI